MASSTTATEAVQLPHDEAAERAVLGAAILRGDAAPLRQVRDYLYSSRHRSIADAAIEVADSGGVPEIVAVKARLEQRGELSQLGGPVYLAMLIEEVPRCANIDSYVEVIQNQAWRRAVLQRAEGLTAAVGEGDSDRTVLELLDGLSEERPAGRLRAEPMDLYDPSISPTAPRWFVERLLPRPGVVLVWAKPSGGKTFLLLRIVHELLFVDNQDVLLGHPELRIVERPKNVIWVATEEVVGRLRDRAEMVLHGLDAAARPDRLLYISAIDVKPPFTLDDLPAVLKARPADLVVLDSLTGLRPKVVDGRSIAWDRDNDAANTYCLMLRGLAAEFNTTIVLVHHTGRDAGRGYRGPTDWWASADVMFGIKPGASAGMVQIHPEKCRDGRLLPPFNLELSWDANRFSVGFGGTEAKKLLTGKAKEVAEFIRARRRVPQARIFAEVPGGRSTLQDAIKKVIHEGLAYFTGDNEERSPVIEYREAEDHDEVPEVTAGSDDDAK